jgi:hypothetical protein
MVFSLEGLLLKTVGFINQGSLSYFATVDLSTPRVSYSILFVEFLKDKTKFCYTLNSLKLVNNCYCVLISFSNFPLILQCPSTESTSPALASGIK